MMDQILAMYIRISQQDKVSKDSHGKVESNSICNQRAYIKQYLDQMGIDKKNIREFIDDGYSGTNFNRPGLQKLFSLCTQRKVACIIVKDFSRFGRNYLEMGNCLEQLFPLWGIRFISINDHFDSDVVEEGSSGLQTAFQNLVYDWYSRDLSNKVYSAIGTKMKQGRYLPGTAPYGFQNDKVKITLVPDPEAARVVQRIFQDVAKGKSTAQVAAELNQEGILTPLVYKRSRGEYLKRRIGADCQWDHRKITKILHNEKYIGTMVYRINKSMFVGGQIKRKQPKDKWICIEDHHHPLVKKEVYHRANANINGWI